MQMLPEEETPSLVQSASLIGQPGLMLPGLESLWGGALSRTRALPIPGSPMSRPLSVQGWCYGVLPGCSTSRRLWGKGGPRNLHLPSPHVS